MADTLIDRGQVWSIPHMDDLRFMKAHFIKHAFKPHAHDYFVLGIIEQGLQSYTHNRDQHYTSPGEIIIINPGEVHTGESAVAHGFSYRALYPSAQWMASLTSIFATRTNTLPYFGNTLIVDNAMYRQIRTIHRLSEMPSSAMAVETMLLYFFVSFVKRYAKGDFVLPMYQTAQQAIRIVCDYINTYYARPITLDDLSAHVHISPFHLARLFTQEMGITPHKYLESVRIKRAEALICAGMPLADVALAVGFSSQSHLNRSFKHFLGITPNTLRKHRKIL
ncbi:MAG: AraC family transcriptional regulator [Chloroflexota bacterium]